VNRLRRLTIDTRHWGVIDVLRPLPHEERQGEVMMVDPWGDLAPLRDEPDFAQLIPVVTGEAFSDALHGWAKPLVESIGPEPEFQLKRLPAKYRVCSLRGDCMMYDEKRCYPGKKLPECWMPEVEESARRAAAVVTLAWAEGRYVVVVEGGEFSL